MPVQINELVIRAQIVEDNKKEKQPDDQRASGLNKDDIIKECAALVLEIINNKNQR